MGEPPERYLLVDGNNVLSRAAFALKNRGVALSSNGVNTSALLLFINMMSKYVRLTYPTHVSVYWDSGHAFRDRIYPAYKANREPPGTRDATPFAQAKQFLTLAGIQHGVRPGWEADDLIACTARSLGGSKVVLSGDKDLLQMLDPYTVQYRPGIEDDTVPWTPERFEEKYGYPAHQMPLVKALMGDRGDNVPGLPGVGPVKAIKMLEAVSWDWGALLDTLTPEQYVLAEVSRDLVDLRYLDYKSQGLRCPMVSPFTPTGQDDMLWEPLTALLRGLEMSTVLDRLEDRSLWLDPSAEAQADLRAQSVQAFSDFLVD